MNKQEEHEKIVEEIACRILYSSDAELASMTTSTLLYDFSISRSHAAVLLKKHTRYSIHKFIEQEKIFRIREKILEDSTYTIERGCEEFGICKSEHLINKFRSKFILTPGKYKRIYHTMACKQLPNT